MSRLSVSQRIRIVRIAFQAECAVLNKAHCAKLARYATMPHEWQFLPESVHACEDIGRRALREMIAEQEKGAAL